MDNNMANNKSTIVNDKCQESTETKEPMLTMGTVTFDELVQELTGVSAKDFYKEFYNLEGKND